jgi:hypothetical protein
LGAVSKLEVRTSEIRGETVFKLEINEKKYPTDKAKGSARKYNVSRFQILDSGRWIRKRKAGLWMLET